MLLSQHWPDDPTLIDIALKAVHRGDGRRGTLADQAAIGVADQSGQAAHEETSTFDEAQTSGRKAHCFGNLLCDIDVGRIQENVVGY